MEWLQEYLQEFTYLGIFGLLVVGGFGLSASEEAVLLLAGVVMYAAEWDPVGVLVACYTGAVTADTISYFIGRGFGARILATRWARLAFHPRRLRRVRRWFHEYGTWALFYTRFMVGIRAAAIFSAGAQRFSFPKFLIADAAAAAVHVPVLVGVGYYCSKMFWDVEGGATAVSAILTGSALIAAFLWYRRRKKRGTRASGV